VVICGGDVVFCMEDVDSRQRCAGGGGGRNFCWGEGSS
jgi:hypothetical protein